MTTSVRQSVETLFSGNHSTLVAYPNRYAFVGQCIDMLWSRPINKGESG